jgi:hypothetical protein
MSKKRGVSRAGAEVARQGDSLLVPIASPRIGSGR